MLILKATLDGKQFWKTFGRLGVFNKICSSWTSKIKTGISGNTFKGYVTYFDDSRVGLLYDFQNLPTIVCALSKNQYFATVLGREPYTKRTLCNLPKTNRPDVDFRFADTRFGLLWRTSKSAHRIGAFLRRSTDGVYLRLYLAERHRPALGDIITIETRLVPRKCRRYFPTAAAAVRRDAGRSENIAHGGENICTYRCARSARGRFCAHASADTSCLIIVLGNGPV